MRQALEHLIVRHGCRRIAFIRGPSVNAEAEHRYAIYRPVLEERGLAFDPTLVCEGTFEKSAGEAAVELLVDERKVQFDALAAANDYMALGAIPALQERDLQVPSDVAVVGFDDIEDARFSTPPLTTVRQPLYQQGEAALELVLAQLEGAQVAPQTTAATELVVRLSCGCLSGLTRPGPRRHRHPDARRRSRACSSSTATTSRARSRARVHGADTVAAAGLGPPAARRVRGRAARRRRRPVRVDARPPARPASRSRATTWAPGRG